MNRSKAIDRFWWFVCVCLGEIAGLLWFGFTPTEAVTGAVMFGFACVVLP